MKNKKLIITLGDPHGIGPEIVIKSLNTLKLSKEQIILVANKDILHFYRDKKQLGLKIDYEVINIDYDMLNFQVGLESKYSGAFSFLCLKKACELAQNIANSVIVTAPVSKNALNMAGFEYSGQTEILERFLQVNEKEKAEMLFAAEDLNVFLLTRHIPLVNVSKFLTVDLIVEKIMTLNTIFKNIFNISSPKFALCGINPHAGENGLLGDEENKLLTPALKKLKEYNIVIDGPFVADALFAKVARDFYKGQTQTYDCYITPYHDQGLIPVKMLAPDKAVNVTIGLPVLRTSPAHGTAFDIAGQNIAKIDSMCAAINFAFRY